MESLHAVDEDANCSKEVDDCETCFEGLSKESAFESDDDAITSAYGSINLIPDVGDICKPVIGSRFENLNDAFYVYQKYASAAGFEIRKATQIKGRKGLIRMKYFLCSKEGFKKRKSFDSLASSSNSKKRRRPEFRSGCGACLKLRFVDGKYEVYIFEEGHNHCLVSVDNSHLQRSNRRMNYSHKVFALNASNANIGPVKSFNLVKELTGSFDRVGATKTDFKNFSRDYNSFIGSDDVQLILDKYAGKKETEPNFTFEYCIGDDGELGACFWADEICKLNYDAFGDVVSFDATFKTNKYNMVFVPFTGIDNHHKCVIFAIGLLCSEEKEVYKWLLECFVNTYSKEPYLLLTDQDPAMKIAIEAVFKTARHRLCMWHIMNKLPGKVGSKICDEGFRSRLHSLVWSETIEEFEFEEKWSSLIEEFELGDHKWLKEMYAIRQRWIPAYFRNVKMSGLMKTTSRSESENYFFGQNSNWNSTLFQFFTRLETAMDKQRYNQRVLDHDTRMTTPMLETYLQIEKHAAEVYTREVFYIIQQEILASLYTCSALSCDIIYDRDKERKGEFKVTFNKLDKSASCSCLHFERFGLLCRHILYVYRHHDIDRIPKGYILDRWKRDAVKLPSRNPALNGNPETNNVLCKVYSSVGYVIDVLGSDAERLGQFLDCINSFLNEVDAGCSSKSFKTKKETIESLIGIVKPIEVTVQVPKQARNKGCGRSKRYVSAREEAISKTKRLCRSCGQRCYHDSRNCPENSEK